MKKTVITGLLLLGLLTGCGVQPTESTVSLPTISTTAATQEKMTVSTTEETAYRTHTTASTISTTSSTQTKTTVATTEKTTSRTHTTSSTISTTVPTRAEVSVTIPEGYSFMQIAKLLESKKVCSAAAFYEVCQRYEPQSFVISTDENRCFRMEGYLFPDTYRFYVGDNPQMVLIRMLNNFRDKVGEIDEDTLILASIIEREARSDEHMKKVSSVFHNRLNNGAMFPYLNADPTRDYVNLYITGNPLVANPNKYPALYNTCNKRRGLPAGPICSPGLRAIQAAKQPEETPYYYFFFGKDGNNHYSETLQEHEGKMEAIGVWLA